MSKITVDQSKCVGCGACVAISPANFDFDDEGLSKVIGEEITDETRDACESCPFAAITINEEEAGEETVNEEETVEETVNE